MAKTKIKITFQIGEKESKRLEWSTVAFDQLYFYIPG